MTLPLTATRPAAISSSQSRREAMPALASTFCSRSALKTIPLCIRTKNREQRTNHPAIVLYSLFVVLCVVGRSSWETYVRGDGPQKSDRAHHHQAAPKLGSRTCVERR